VPIARGPILRIERRLTVSRASYPPDPSVKILPSAKLLFTVDGNNLSTYQLPWSRADEECPGEHYRTGGTACKLTVWMPPSMSLPPDRTL
jgi:hypothetical protein